MVLISPHPIKIRSPRRKESLKTILGRGETPPHEGFADLLRVSREVYTEAVDIYYKENTFAFGVGQYYYGSPTTANRDGREAFLKRVPKGLISLIGSIRVEIAAPIQNYGPDQQSKADSKDLLSVAKFLVKYFPKLRNLKIHDCDTFSLPRPYQPLEHRTIVRNLQLAVGLLHENFAFVYSAKALNPVLNFEWVTRDLGLKSHPV